MRELHRIKNGLNEWNRLPEGYVQLTNQDRIQPLDVLKMHDEWYCEYPANGMLIGTWPGDHTRWYRKEH